MAATTSQETRVDIPKDPASFAYWAADIDSVGEPGSNPRSAMVRAVAELGLADLIVVTSFPRVSASVRAGQRVMVPRAAIYGGKLVDSPYGEEMEVLPGHQVYTLAVLKSGKITAGEASHMVNKARQLATEILGRMAAVQAAGEKQPAANEGTE